MSPAAPLVRGRRLDGLRGLRGARCVEAARPLFSAQPTEPAPDPAEATQSFEPSRPGEAGKRRVGSDSTAGLDKILARSGALAAVASSGGVDDVD